jgi:hypothetical protein
MYFINAVELKSIGESLFKIKCNREVKAIGIKNENLKNIGKMKRDFNGRLISVL